MTPKLDEVVMRELVEDPGWIYGFPKRLQPKVIPVPPVGRLPFPMSRSVKSAAFIGLLRILGIVRRHNTSCGQLMSLTFLSIPATRGPQPCRTALCSTCTRSHPWSWVGSRYRYMESRVHGIGPSSRSPPRRFVDHLLKMYEFATGHWLFQPEAKDDISRDVVHLAQMTQRTGQDHDDAALKQYETREEETDLKGGCLKKNSILFTLLFSRLAEVRNCGGN